MADEEPSARILVVDDNAANRALARACLEDEGHVVVEAPTGEAGLAAFAREAPACVLLDVSMPDLDGFAVCRRLRALPGGADARVIFFTALRDVDTFDRALAAGGDDFLMKPVRPTELAVRVRTALELRRASADGRANVELVQKQRDDLVRLQLQKERLTSFVVHDLKNPVFALDLHAQALLRDRELSPKSRDAVLHIRGEARALLRLVTNLLDIAKSEEGRLTPRPAPIDLPALVGEVVDALAVRGQPLGVTLVTAVDVPAVTADPDLLRRVLENLVDNAIRHAPEQSEVRIAARALPGAVELRVTDAGAGVPPDACDRIFERYAQLDPASERTSRGLGLAFCKLAVEAHGGTIGVEQAYPGAAFWVRLPHA